MSMNVHRATQTAAAVMAEIGTAASHVTQLRRFLITRQVCSLVVTVVNALKILIAMEHVKITCAWLFPLRVQPCLLALVAGQAASTMVTVSVTTTSLTIAATLTATCARAARQNPSAPLPRHHLLHPRLLLRLLFHHHHHHHHLLLHLSVRT